MLSYYATHLLASASKVGLIDFSRISRALDFGAGYGGPTTALKDYLNADCILDAAERDPGRAIELIKYGIVETGHVYRDGIQHLEAFPYPKYDLVTGFSFGPDPTVTLFSSLLRASLSGISEEGQIVITSDPTTFMSIMSFCREINLPFTVNAGQSRPYPQLCTPSTLHVYQSDCQKLQGLILEKIPQFLYLTFGYGG